jgi:hypothetical protein
LLQLLQMATVQDEQNVVWFSRLIYLIANK